MQFTLTSVDLAAAAIIRAAKANPNITVSGLQDEMERGDIDGWMTIVNRHNLSFAGWTAAMEIAIARLDQQR